METKNPLLCPRCGRESIDLRGCGFNPTAIEQEGKCYRWAQDTFTCVTSGAPPFVPEEPKLFPYMSPEAIAELKQLVRRSRKNMIED